MGEKEKEEKETAEKFWNKLSEEEKEEVENLKEYWHKVAGEEEREREQRERKQQEKKGGEFYIRLKKGTMASHLIKVKGVFKKKWDKHQIERYIKAKIEKEINDYYEAELELLKVEENRIEVWVFIATVGYCETIKEWANEWLEHHITQSPDEVERGISEIESVEVEAVSPLSRMMEGQ